MSECSCVSLNPPGRAQNELADIVKDPRGEGLSVDPIGEPGGLQFGSHVAALSRSGFDSLTMVTSQVLVGEDAKGEGRVGCRGGAGIRHGERSLKAVRFPSISI